MKKVMKLFSVLILALTCSLGTFGQNIKLTGTISDPSGAVVPGAKVKATSKDERQSIAQSNTEGVYVIDLVPGTYRLEVNSPGFVTYIIDQYLVKDAASGEMNFSMVLTGRTDHEPCGYGGDCGYSEEIKIEKPILQDNISLRPIIEVPKQTKPISKKKIKNN